MCLLVRDYISQLPFIPMNSSYQRNGSKSEGCHFWAKAAKKLLPSLFALLECRTRRGSKGWQNQMMEGAWVPQLPCKENLSPTGNTYVEIWGFTCYRC